MIDTFDEFEDFVRRKLRQVDTIQSVRDSLDIAISGPAGEAREAAAMFFCAGELSKLYKAIRDACQEFLKRAIAVGTEAEVGEYKINHYTRRVFDKSAWEHWCQTDDDLRPLWESYQQLEAAKKRDKEQFQYLDSSVRVTHLKESNML